MSQRNTAGYICTMWLRRYLHIQYTGIGGGGGRGGGG
jgi:hypothetical protein